MGCCYSNINKNLDVDFEYGKEFAEKNKRCKKYNKDYSTEKSDLLFNIQSFNPTPEILNSFAYIKITPGVRNECEIKAKNNFVKIPKIEYETSKNETINLTSFLESERRKLNKLKEDTKKSDIGDKKENELFNLKESIISVKDEGNSFISSIKNDISKNSYIQVEKAKPVKSILKNRNNIIYENHLDQEQ